MQFQYTPIDWSQLSQIGDSIGQNQAYRNLYDPKAWQPKHLYGDAPKDQYGSLMSRLMGLGNMFGGGR